MEATNLTKELTHLTHRVSFLEEENRWLKSQLFGRSSEKRPQDIAVEQQRLFNEAEGLAANVDTESVTIGEYQRKKTSSKKIPLGLPRVEIVHDLPDAEKFCVHDGTALVRIGEEACVSNRLRWFDSNQRFGTRHRHGRASGGARGEGANNCRCRRWIARNLSA